ncbi:PKD domain-containing protein [Fulvivirga ulvae]|uniref:PKD domain-containing protein n=1 Tax=Fulvivirga ulvae TaxID=2904245 RepID=UPI001F390786|nr:PKD domain-containing protein [Fulvivirga ulvae]UII32048.1 PKD domain-containing protein [Fulvivirga ulvae]
MLIKVDYKWIALIGLLFSFISGYSQLTADFTYVTPGDSCGSRTVQFNAGTSTGSITDYIWGFNDKDTGTSLGTGSGMNTMKNFLSPGTYVATLTVSGPGGVSSKSVDIRVYNKPVVDFSTDVVEGCPPLDVTFTDLSGAGDGVITKWEWNYNDGTKDEFTSSSSPTHGYSASGEYTPTLIVTNSFGCTNSKPKNKLIKVYNKVTPAFLVFDNYSCSTPHMVNIENLSPLNGAFNYLWDFGDGSTPAIDNNNIVSHEYTSSGVFKIKLTAINSPGTCSASKTSSGSQNVYIGEPQADFNLPAQVCVGQGLNIGALADPTGLSNSGRWYFEDTNTTASGTSSYHVFNIPGVWNVSYISKNSYSLCESKEVIRSITVLPSPDADFSLDLPDGCQVPHIVTFNNLSTGAANYEWNFGDGTPVLTTASTAPVTHSFNTYGTFTIRLKAINADNCSDTKLYHYVRNKKPSVDFDYSPQEGCRPLAVKIKAKPVANDPIVQYSYIFSDGTVHTSNLPDFTHTFTASGSHTIKVSILTQQGCVAVSDEKAVSVSDVCFGTGGGAGGGGGGGPLDFIRAPGCSDRYTFTFENTIPNSTVISWDFEGTLMVTNQNPITYTFPDNLGKKEWIVTARVQENVTGAPIVEYKTGVLIVDERADYSIDNTDICKNVEVNFKTLGIDSTLIKTYTWDFGDSTGRLEIDNETYYNDNLTYHSGDVSHIYKDNGVFYTKLIIEDVFSCLDSLEYPVPVAVKGPEAGFELDKNKFCGDDFIVALSDTSVANGITPIISRMWELGDGSPVLTPAGDTTFLHNYTHNTFYKDYTIRLEIEDAVGCKDSEEKKVQSYAPKADFWSKDTLRCEKFNVFFYNSSKAQVSSNNQYTWEYGDGITSNGYYGNHTFPSDGKYSVKLKVVDNGGCVDSLVREDFVKLVRPVADFDIGSDTSKCVGTFSLPFVSTSTYSKSFEWDFGDNEYSSTNQIEVSHFYEKAGLYDVKLSVTGLDGCTDDTVKQVKIKGPVGELKTFGDYFCLGNDYSIKIDGNNIKDFYWDFGDLSPTDGLVNQDSVVHQYQAPGKYLPNVILLSPENCQITLQVLDTVYVDKLDNGLPANIECGDTHTTLKGSTALNLPGKYYWEGPATADFQPDIYSMEIQVNTPGFYSLRAKNSSCGQQDSVEVTSSGIIPDAEAGADQKIDCIDEDAQLYGATTTADTRYEWSGPAGAVFIPDHTVSDPIVNVPGTYKLRVIQKECDKTDLVQVLPCSLDPTDKIITQCADIPGLPATYQQFDLTLLDNTVVGSVQASVSWYEDQEFIQIVATPKSVPLTHNKPYFAKISSMDGTETARAKVTVIVHDYVKASIVADADSICIDDGPITLKRQNFGGNEPGFEWYFENRNNPLPGEKEQVDISEPSASGWYFLRSHSPFCQDSWDSVGVKIYEKAQLSFTSSSLGITYHDENMVELPLEIYLKYPEDISNIVWYPDGMLRQQTAGGSFLSLNPDSLVARPFHQAVNEEEVFNYEVTVFTGPEGIGCESSASIIVENFKPVDIPNIFSPNNDGINDTWVIDGLAKYPNTSVKVFDRYGSLIYEGDHGYQTPWDGTYRGAKVPFGTYYYVADFQGSEDNTDYQTEGWVMVVK